jgi:glycosyltransferase involved in cell wall biosynthesis
MKRIFRILQIIETAGPGGAEIVFLNIAKNMDRNRFYVIAVLMKMGWLYNQLLENKIETKIIRSRHSWDLGFLYRLVQICRRFKIDLIHSHLADTNLYSCLSGTIARIPKLAIYHNEILLPGRVNRYNALKLFLVRKLATQIVFVADYVKADFINNAGFPDKKSATIYNGIDIAVKRLDFDLWAKRSELGIKPANPIIGNVANLRTPKGHRYLIEAAALVCKELPEVKFLLIGEKGDGKLKAEIDGQIGQLNLENNVQLLGFRKDVQELLRVIDVFVLSSISEGLPLSVVEAMASSKPVVATNVGGLSELVISGENGFLVPARSPEALAEKILVLLKNRDLRESMGKKGREIAQNKFSLDRMIENYQNLYDKLLS